MALDLTMLDGGIDTEVASGKALMLSAAVLLEDPDNPRTSFDEVKLAEFAEDIKRRGILQPIIVRPADGANEGKYFIRFGARRFRAGQLAGLESFPVLIATDERQFDSYSQVAENNQRENLTPLELSVFIATRLKAGDKKKDIASGLNVAATQVTFLSALIDAPAFVMELYHSGKCVNAEYLYKVRNLSEKHPGKIEELAASADVITRQWIDQTAAKLNSPAEVPLEVAPAGVAPNPPEASPSAELASLTDASSGQGALKESEPAKVEVNAEATTLNSTEASSKVKYRVIMLKHQGRAAHLVLTRRASAVGLGWIRYADDGQEVEITLSDAILDSLIEG